MHRFVKLTADRWRQLSAVSATESIRALARVAFVWVCVSAMLALFGWAGAPAGVCQN